MRKCLHCSFEGPDAAFATYKDKKGRLRIRNSCISCHRRHARDRQAQYKEKNLEKVRELQRNRKYLKYWNDPEFREKCKKAARKKYHERSTN